MSAAAGHPRRLVPETIQTSMMDCGPAALRSLLAGMGIDASYGRLREACQTDVDGTAIGALEQCARALGLDVAQLMLPADHVALPGASALPAIAVTRLASGMPHFVVLWRRTGRLVQLMDPGTGRRFVPARGLLAMLYVHEQPVPAQAWAGFCESPAFVDPLTARLAALVGARRARELVARGSAAGPQAVAALDAQARAGPNRSGAAEALAAAIEDPAGARERLAPDAWFARPLDGDGETVLLRGAVVVLARGQASEPPDPARLTPELRAALTEPAPQPARRLLAVARAQGRVPVRALMVAGVVLAAGAIAEVTLLRHAVGSFRPGPVVGAVAILAAVLMVVEAAVASAGLAVGRRLEVGLRAAMLAKLPRLPDRYLSSRPPSDMADRVHLLHELQLLPLLASQLVSAVTETVLVAGALCVLDPSGAPLVIAATVLALAVAFAVQSPLREREQRQREHASALAQTTLDALLGLVAVRAHGAERVLVAEHRSRLDGWRAAAAAATRARAGATLVQSVCAIGLTIPVVVNGLGHVNDVGGRLLVVLWAITIPFTAERVGQLALQWPALRTLALRQAEPLDAPDAPGCDSAPRTTFAGIDGGVEIMLDGASVRATGHEVVHPTSLRLHPGQHVALVGASGAGKSTLCALVLGLTEPSGGRVLADGVALDRAAARGLWPTVAWVDSQVRVWNRPLADNIAPGARPDRVAELVAAAELGAVAARVDDEPLGADGGLLSGGETQRVRLARAFGQDGVRLAVLDEALRGLDRDQRHRLLQRARQRWREATVLCATHDVHDALTFDRVLVMDGGRVVADGRPDDLLAADGSQLRALLDAEQALQARLDEGPWRRLRVSDGTVREEQPASPGPPPPESLLAAAPRRDDDEPELPAARGESLGAGVGWLAAFVAASFARFGLFIASWREVGQAITTGDTSASGLTGWALLLAATVPLAALATLAQGQLAVTLGARLRARLLAGALALDPAWIRRQGPGRVLGRTMEVEPVTRLAVAGGLEAITATIQLALAAVVLLSVGPGRPVAALLAGVLVLGALTATLATLLRRRWTAARLAETDELLEAIAGQRTRLVQGDDRDQHHHQQRLARYLELSRQADAPLAILDGALPRAALVAGLAGLCFAGNTPYFGDPVVALGGLLLAASAMRRAAGATNALMTATLARHALAPILTAARHADTPTTTPAAGRTDRGPVPAAGRGVQVRGLTVRRDGRPVLDDVDLTLAPGERSVLVGASGAGKSTLAAALTGLLATDQGTIALDHSPLDSRTPAWRRHVQLVPQHNDNHILLAPLAFNVLLGRHWPPTDQDLQAATDICHDLQLGPLLARMPAGLAQVVGETGWRLSHGERARIQLARALLADPDVLILDEPLGALDPATAQLILDIVDKRARTLLLISQQ